MRALVGLVALMSLIALQVLRAPRHGFAPFPLALVGFAIGIVGEIVLAWRRSRWTGAPFLGVLLLPLLHPAEPAGTPRRRLEAVGDHMIEALEAHHARTGTYPVSLEAAGIVPEPNNFGGWHYSSGGAGAFFTLWVGEYNRDGFVLMKTVVGDESGDRGWHWDT